MSPLKSDLCHSRSPLTAATLPMAQKSLVIGAFGYCLLAAVSCSFDARPNNAGKLTNATSDSRWKPPSAADAMTDQDSATDAMARQVSVQRGPSDAGQRPSQPSAASDAGRAHRDMDASVPAQKPPATTTKADAGKERERDAQVPDAAKPAQHEDAAMASEHCKSGMYTGTFSGSLQIIGLSLSSVTGTVRAELVRDASGERLELHNGDVVGVDQDGNRLTCDLTGSIDCSTDRLEDGKLENGNFHNVGSDSDTSFTGSAEATYSQDPYSLVGTFSVEAKETLVFGGRGTWSLIRGN